MTSTMAWPAHHLRRSGGRHRIGGAERCIISLLGALLIASAGISTAAAQDAAPLRLCVDPDNLPFSSNRPETPGLYLEIGNVIGRALGRPVTPVWALTYFGKRALRTTLLADRCDAFVGVPVDQDFMGPRIIYSKPLLQVGYALVTTRSAPITSLDGLRNHRVAVQFRSTPQGLLAGRDDVATVTFLEPEKAVQALADGEVDVAFVWGPVAAYMNKTVLHERFTVTPVQGPGLQWPAAVGFARHHAALRDDVDRAIDASRAEVAALALKYGLVTGSEAEVPVEMPGLRPVQGAVMASTGKPNAGGAANESSVAEGKDIFNSTCAHCHGPNAVQAERRINLRLLRHRYGEEMDDVFLRVVTRGRPDKGMPSWSEVLTTEQLDRVLAFLRTVQGE